MPGGQPGGGGAAGIDRCIIPISNSRDKLKSNPGFEPGLDTGFDSFSLSRHFHVLQVPWPLRGRKARVTVRVRVGVGVKLGYPSPPRVRVRLRWRLEIIIIIIIIEIGLGLGGYDVGKESFLLLLFYICLFLLLLFYLFIFLLTERLETS